MIASEQKLSVKEKVGYSLGDLAANLVFQTLITYLAYFYTDIYGLKPGDASAVMLTVGLIAAFGFNPIVGAIADRTVSKWGKFQAMDFIYRRSAWRYGFVGVQHTTFLIQGKSDLCGHHL